MLSQYGETESLIKKVGYVYPCGGLYAIMDNGAEPDMMASTRYDLSRYRARIIRESVDTFRTASYFRGKGKSAEGVVQSVSEGLLDLLEEGPSRDYDTVRLYAEWLYNLIRKEGKKIDTTLDFLDRFEQIVTRHLPNKEDADVDVFFEMCREIVERRHNDLLR